MASKIVILLTFLITQVFCEQKNGLTFVIDDTASMDDELAQVKNASKAIVDIVLNEKSSQIEDIVLVTFNDPGNSFIKRTRDAKELKQSLDNIVVHGGGFCPEMSLSGIKLALLESQPGSYLYVFTDASAKDYTMFEEIKSLCQEKQSQIVFILTGNCGNIQSPKYQVYYKIAAACNGQVFSIHKGEVGQVLEFVKESIKGERTVITSKIVPPFMWSYVPFNIDDKTEYAVVSASGSGVILKVEDHMYRYITGYDKITWTQNVKVMKLTNLRPGLYYAKVLGSSDVNVMVFGRTDFTFEYGFSNKVEDSLKLTETQPTTGMETHLMISVKDPEHSVVVQAVEILDMNETVLATLPLTEVGEMYATWKILPPDHMFKVAVTATGRSTGKQIRRIAKTPVAPIKPVTVAPEISDTETIITPKEGSTAHIHCRIRKGKPKPHITWYFMQQGAREFKLMEDRTDDVLRVTDVTDKHAGQYQCVAENSAGQAKHTVQLDVQVRPQFEKTSGVLTTKEKLPVTIKCKLVKGNPPPKITWYWQPNDPTARSTVMPGNEVITLSSVQYQQAGQYRCVAENTAGTDEMTIKLNVLVAPEIENNAFSVVNVKENSTKTIQCNLLKGNPIPSVTWLYKSPESADYVMMSKYNMQIRLYNIQLKNAGHYKCEAKNSEGSAERVIELNVEAPPRIVFVPPNKPEYRGVEGDVVMKLPCNAVGFPTPQVTWMVDDSVIGADTSQPRYVEDGTLFVMNPTSELSTYNATKSHNYVCHASNKFGEAHQRYEVYISEFEDYNETEQKYGVIKQPYSINCSLPFKNPDSVRWFYNSVFMNKTGPSLYWEHPKQENNGNYTCRVSDMNGVASETVEVIFGSPPTVSTTSWDLEWSGEELEITCSAQQIPSGKYEWYYHGEKIKEAHTNALSIDLIGWGQYTCRTSNPLGSLDITYNITTKDCFIDKNLLKEKNMPVILNGESAWPTFSGAQNYLIIPQLDKLNLICQDEPPKSKGKSQSLSFNSFMKFPSSRTIVATCDHEDLFLVDGVPHRLSELTCKDPVMSSVVPTNIKCLGENTQMINVGFYINEFTNVYWSCLDTKSNVTLYATVNITGSDSVKESVKPKGKCRQVAECCFETVQLVNAADVSFGPAEKATFRDPLNSVSYCRPNDNTTSWHDIEEQVRKVARTTVWSGAYNYTKVDNLLVPQYLWKVVKDLDNEETVAIIHLNGQTEVPQICKDVCNKSTWFEPYGSRTYCCSMEEFKLHLETTFSLTPNIKDKTLFSF